MPGGPLPALEGSKPSKNKTSCVGELKQGGNLSVAAQAESAGAGVSEGRRWLQLVIGIVCMVMIANYQYGWTFFVPDIEKTFGWKASDIQVAFTLFVLFETWLVPIEGWFVDRFGPRIVVLAGGVLCGIGWWMTSRATSL